MYRFRIKSVKKHFLKRFGIGFKTLFKFYLRKGLNTRLNNKLRLKKKHTNRFNRRLKKKTTGRKLKLQIKNTIKFYIKIKNIKGLRHKLSYPVRGQRTHTNARTRKKMKTRQTSIFYGTLFKKKTFKKKK